MAKPRSSLRYLSSIAALLAMACAMSSASVARASNMQLHGGGSGGGGGSGSSGSGGGGGSSGSGSWGSGTSGSGSWGSGSSGSGSGSSGSSGSGDYGSGSGSGSSGSGSGSSNSGSGSSNSGSGKSGSDDASWSNLAARENPEFDLNGSPTRRGEVISLNMEDRQIKATRKQGFSVIEKSKLEGLDLEMVRWRAPKGMKADDAIKILRAENPDIFFELDHYFGVTSGGIDKSAGDQMVDMKVPVQKPLWIGMIDTAVWKQATLRSARIDARDFAHKSGRPAYAHGTAVASILHRQGAVRITSANVFIADGQPYSSADAIARAVSWMVERKVPVINISIAGPQNALVDRVVAAATAKGHVVVAAAGNGGPAAPPAFPAASPGAIAVTAIDRAGHVYPNANRGVYIDMSAIGVGIGAEAPDGTLKPHSGTSFAAPFVSAVLARCITVASLEKASSCVKSMESRAIDLGAKGRDPIYGVGMLVP